MATVSHIHTSIIIPTRNHAAMLMRLVDGLRKTASVFNGALELIIVDNNSDEPELSHFLKDLITNQSNEPFASIQALPYPHKFNYSAINNFAVTKSAGKNLCFLNNDIEIIEPTWLTALREPLERAGTGCVGAMLYYPDDTIQHAGVYLDAKNIAGHLYKNEIRGAHGDDNYLVNEQVVSAVTAACMMVSKKVFNEVNGFNESLTVAFNDVDLCLKVKQAGYDNIWTPAAELYHHESKSRGLSNQRSFRQKLNHKKEVFLMKRQWHVELETDDRHPEFKAES